MWTWGDGPFGRAWCANLTDNGDRYIELMTGVYTDNQPDFTYIMPGETKVLHPGLVPHATPSAKPRTPRWKARCALSVKDGEARFGALPTCERKGADRPPDPERARRFTKRPPICPPKTR